MSSKAAINWTPRVWVSVASGAMLLAGTVFVLAMVAHHNIPGWTGAYESAPGWIKTLQGEDGVDYTGVQNGTTVEFHVPPGRYQGVRQFAAPGSTAPCETGASGIVVVAGFHTDLDRAELFTDLTCGLSG